MTVQFADTWLDDVRSSNWYRRFSRKDPSSEVTSDGTARWTYADENGNALYENLAEEILAVNQPFLESFSENTVWNALGTFAMSNVGDDFNGAHCRAIVGEEAEDVVTVEQGMHQPEDDDVGGFQLHVTIRLTSTSNDEDTGNVGQPRHVYMMQNNDGSLYVTSMT